MQREAFNILRIAYLYRNINISFKHKYTYMTKKLDVQKQILLFKYTYMTKKLDV